MSLEDQAHSGGIDDTTEWRLVYALRQHSHLFTFNLPRSVATSGRGRKTLELRNTIYLLDEQIRIAFTTLQLDLLLYIELEKEDYEYQAVSEAKLDGKSGWTRSDSAEDSNNDSDDDSDDVSSQSSMDTQSTSSPQKRLASLDHLPSPSVNKALNHLRELCTLLEKRVNHLLISIEPGDSDQSRSYPRLTRLIEYLYRLSPSLPRLEFIPSTRSAPGRFLFNIADDTATADAFVAFTDPEQMLPHRESRQRMLTSAKFLHQAFNSFNCFINNLQFSAASLNNTAMQPSEISASNQSFPTFALLQKFRQQTATAYRTILSHVNYCTSSEPMKHRILLQLPGWGEVSECDSRNVTDNLSVRLFFTICPSNEWQFARMSSLMPEHTRVYRQRKLYNALKSSHGRGVDLDFYVSEECKGVDDGEIRIHVPNISDPNSPESTRTYDKSLPHYKNRLQTLVKDAHFAKEASVTFFRSTDGKGTILEIEKRKDLAIKLVLGLMVSMDSDHILESWDPKYIHLLNNVGDEHTPFVSISGYQNSTSRQKRLPLATLFHCSNLDENGDNLKPLPQFALLAKAILEIARGEPLHWIKKSELLKIYRNSPSAFLTEWIKLRNTIDSYSRYVVCTQQADLKILPFIQAALGCLEFHFNYQSRIIEEKSSQKIDVAWKVAFETIILRIDGNLTLKGLNKSNTEVLTEEDRLFIAKQPSQTNNELFDTKQAAKASTANEFWTLLEKFHESYSRFVPERGTQSGVESPQRIRIAVLDTGVDFHHSAIMEARDKGRMKQEWCHSWVEDTPGTTDDDDELHGTNCAYLLHKAAPEADIYIGKVFRENSLTFREAENISKAIEYAVNTWNVDIISMSFGLRPPTARRDGNKDEERLALEKYREIIGGIKDAIRGAAYDSRILFAAASNSGKNEPRAFPADFHPFVICVHASEGNGEDGGINPEIEDGFNFMTLGMGIELMEREWVEKLGRKFAKYKTVIKSGTSFATPIAAGIAATVLDLATRVEAIDSRAENELKRFEGMRKMLRIMSSPQDVRDRLSYMAPWHLWESGWEIDEFRYRSVWDTINKLF